jgi:nucleotide-binding universal stress UspA family protein
MASFSVRGVVEMGLEAHERERRWFRWGGPRHADTHPHRTAPTSLPAPDTADLPHAVVVGCDGRPDGDAALRFAAREAQLRGTRLLLVTAFFEPVDPDQDSIEIPRDELRNRARSDAERALCRALGATASTLPEHETITAQGEASRILLDEYGTAEMIVIGTHQRHLLGRILHGHSTSEDLIHHSRVPVVIVPPPHPSH